VFVAEKMTSRVERGVEVLRRLFRRMDLSLVNPYLLKDSNHVTFRANSDVVARVLLDADAISAAQLARECDVSLFLADRGAPVTRPTVDPGPHRIGVDCVTLW